MGIELVLFILFLVLIFLITRHFRVNHLLPPSPFALPIIGHFHLLSPLIHRSFHDLSLRLGPVYSLRLGSIPCSNILDLFDNNTTSFGVMVLQCLYSELKI
ncbi:hypothetical protein ACLB2K_045997 [Fragaria x ananassa]